MKRVFLQTIGFFLLGLLSIMLISACGRDADHAATSSKQPVEDCRMVQHTMGETCIPLHPQRIITLWSTILGNALALGIEPIASTYYTGEPFPEYLRDKVDKMEFVGNLTEPNLEKILLLKPDLILVNTRLQNIYKPLSQIAPTVMLEFPTLPPSWKQQLNDLAAVLDQGETGRSLIDEYWQRIEQLKQVLGDRRHQLQVSVANVSPDFGVWAYGEKSPVGIVLNDIKPYRKLS